MAEPRPVTYVNLNAPAGNYESQLADIKRRQKLAEFLAQQGGEDIKVESVNGIPTPISPFQGLANVFQSGLGAYMQGNAAKEQAALDEAQSQKYADVLSQMYDERPDMSNENDIAVTGRFDPATGRPGANVMTIDGRGAFKRPPTSAEQSRAALGLIGTKYAELVPGMLSDAQRTAAEARETKRYETGQERLDREEAARIAQLKLEADRFEIEQTRQAKEDAESARRFGITSQISMDNANKPETPGSPKTYKIKDRDGNVVTRFMTPQDALAYSNSGFEVSESTPLKPVPAAIAKSIESNGTMLKKLYSAYDLVDKHPNSFGLMFGLSDAANQRLDPQGVLARSTVTDISSLKIHDRSGAVNPEAEMKRLRPFIPNVYDTTPAIKTKINQLIFEVESIINDQSSNYTEDEGYKTPPSLKSAADAIKKRTRLMELRAKQRNP
jgi:hypothetical protein